MTTSNHYRVIAVAVILILIGISIPAVTADINELTTTKIVWDGNKTITDSLDQKSELDADYTKTLAVYSELQKLDLPYKFDAGKTSIIIKKIAYDEKRRVYGAWIEATREGQEVRTRSPIWVHSTPITVIVSEEYNSKNNNMVITQKEDPLAAFRQVFLDYVEGQPLGKSEGDDTEIFYITGAGSSRGFLREYTTGSFNTMRNAAGDWCYTGSDLTGYMISSYTTSDNYDDFCRFGFTFNTSGLPDDCTIDSAKVSFYYYYKLNYLGSPNVGITGISPGTPGSWVTGDYDAFSDTRYASDVSYDTFTTYKYYDWDFNAAGISAISKTGYLHMCVRSNWDIDNSFGGTWVSSKDTGVSLYTTSTGKVAKLTVEYTLGGATPPTANFTSNVTSGYPAFAVQFNDTSTQSPTSWNWSFGDGEYSSSQNASHTYDSWIGNSITQYTVNLTSTNAGGSDSEEKSNYITLYPLNASFSANVTSGESQVAVSFTDATDNGTATNWSWTFGELGTSYDQNPTFNFDTTGTHRVTLNASNEYSYDVYTVDISVDVQNITSSSFIEMVSGVSGKYTSIDLESDGSPHISWVDGSTYTLYRSRLVGDDLMHVWSLTGYDAGNALSWTTIDLDQNDNAHIGYSDYELSAEEDLKEIFINSSGSYITTLGLTNGLYNEGSSPYQRSLKTDAFNYSHIAYEHNGDLYYTFQNDTGWYNETAYTGDYARWASLDLDALGYPHISHYDAGVGYLYYTFKNSSGWYTELVDSGNRGLYSSIRLDSLGYPHISYYDDTNDDLIYTSRNNTAWTYKTVDSTGNVGRYVSLDLDLSGYPHISYYDDTNDDLKYAFQNSTGWYRSILDSNQNVGLYTSIKTRDEGTAHISYYNSTGDDLKYARVTYLIAPIASFSVVDDTDGCAPFTVYFIDSSTGSPTAWSWDLNGDDIEDNTTQNAEYTYSSAGTYTVTLYVSNDCGGDWENKTSYITVGESPVSNFSADDTDGCAPFHVTFTDSSTGSPTAWSWDLNGDDIEDNTTQNAEYTYSSAGTYTVTLYVSNDCGNDWENKTSYITVGESPVSNFSADDTDGCAPFHVTFTDSSTGSPTAWSWDLNGDDIEDNTTQNAEYTYSSAGTYTVTLYVSNDCGNDWENKTSYITVGESPVASFDANITNGCAPLAVMFNSTSTGTEPLIYAWYINGDYYETQNTSYLFAVGTFNVQLNVSNSCGYDWENKTGYITATSAPTAAFTVNDTDGDKPLAVMFTDESTGLPSSWYWDFGDESTSEEQNPEHTYTIAGVYNVSLKATNTCGSDWENKTSYITVNEGCVPPVSSFGADSTNGTSPFHVTFTDSSTGSPTAWSWDLNGDDIEDNTTQNAEYTYSSAGTYTVTLYVSNDCGNDWENKTSYITVGDAPSCGFDANITNGDKPLVVLFTSSSTGTEPMTYYWDVDGDDSFDYYTRNVTHQYDNSGLYTVKQMVLNGYGECWNNKTDYINVTEGCVSPVAIFSANNTIGTIPFHVVFTDSSTGSPTAWSWDLNGDDIEDNTTQNAEYTYDIAGIYTVKLNVSNDCGYSWENKTGYIIVSEPTPPPTPTPAGYGLYQISTDRGESWIRWDWIIPDEKYGNATTISVLLDGVERYNMSMLIASEISTSYTASGLNPDELHTLELIEHTDGNLTNATVLSKGSLSEMTTHSIWYYLFFLIVAIIFSIIGAFAFDKIKSVVFSSCSLIISLYLSVSTLDNNIIVSSISVIILIVSGVIIIYSLSEIYNKTNGWDR